MATPREINEAFELWRAQWPRALDLSPRARESWNDALAAIPGSVLADVAEAILRSEEYPPKLVTVIRACQTRIPRGDPGESAIGPCPDCRGYPGWRELAAHHRTKSGEVVVTVRMAPCECRLGRSRPGPSFRLVEQDWRSRPATLAVHVSWRQEPVLSAPHRYSATELARMSGAPTTSGRSLATATLTATGQDDHAAARRTTRREEAVREADDEQDEGEPVW